MPEEKKREITRSFSYERGRNPNSRNGFKIGHLKMGKCGAPKGSHNSPKTEFKKGQISWNKGKIFSIETRKKLSEAKKGKPAPHKRGENCPFWKGGVTPRNLAVRMSLGYSKWRNKVLKRDRFKCVWCGSSKDIVSDHIKPFALFPSLRLEISNGRTLCVSCHRKTDTFANRFYKTTKEDFLFQESLVIYDNFIKPNINL